MNSVVQRARMNEPKRPHFPRLITEKRFTRVCWAGDSKNQTIRAAQIALSRAYKNIFRCVQRYIHVAD